MKRTLTAIKPTGTIHLGNYISAVLPIIEKQDKDEQYLFVADLHAFTDLNVQKDPGALKDATRALILNYVALGVDPEKVVIYRQSRLPQLTQLMWVFLCLTTVPYLMRSHAYKSAMDKKEIINGGVFNYPILMAADILAVKASEVPVGPDQLQHVEVARDVARTFNTKYGEIFPLPKASIKKEKPVPGIDGKKMSKSYGNMIDLFLGEEEMKKQIMKIATDSKGETEKKNPDTCTVFKLYELLGDSGDLKKEYEKGISYGEAKKMLSERMWERFAPANEKYSRLLLEPNIEEKICGKHEKRLSMELDRVLSEVYDLIGFSPDIMKDGKYEG